MPPEIMSACSKQLWLMLPYFSDKTGKGAAFLSLKKKAVVETLSILLLFLFFSLFCEEGGCCESLIHSWHYKAEPFRHQEMIPSLKTQALKEVYLSSCIGGDSNRKIIQTQPNTHTKHERLTHIHRKKVVGSHLKANKADLAYTKTIFWCVITVLSQTFTCSTSH